MQTGIAAPEIFDNQGELIAMENEPFLLHLSHEPRPQWVDWVLVSTKSREGADLAFPYPKGHASQSIHHYTIILQRSDW